MPGLTKTRAIKDLLQSGEAIFNFALPVIQAITEKEEKNEKRSPATEKLVSSFNKWKIVSQRAKEKFTNG